MKTSTDIIYVFLVSRLWCEVSEFGTCYPVAGSTMEKPGGPCAMNERVSIYADREAKAVLTR